jgi:hypothetical protein
MRQADDNPDLKVFGTEDLPGALQVLRATA